MKALIVAVVACAVLAPCQAFARQDTLLDLPVDQAMKSPDFESRLQGVKFYFGTQPSGVVRKLGEVRTNKKTNGVGKSDTKSCNWVLLSALIALQEEAIQRGGNAVINIKSNYKSNLTTSNSTYVCGVGNLMSGVALVGEVARVQ